MGDIGVHVFNHQDRLVPIIFDVAEMWCGGERSISSMARIWELVYINLRVVGGITF
jgi:hypothetical protein